jgi:Tol biopolymer transport system component
VIRRILGGLVILSLACGDGGTDPSGAAIMLTGRIERGGRLGLALVHGVDTVPPAEVTWQVLPAGVADLTADTSTGGALLIPRAVGQLTVAASARGESTSRVLVVGAPPSLVFALLRAGNRDIWRVALDGADTARLTQDPADDRQPTAAGGAIVFVSSRPAGAGLYAVTLTGEPATPVLLSGTEIAEPSLSRDGTRLAFTSYTTGVPKVWVARHDGTGARRLAPAFGFDGAIEGWPAWSPDSRYLSLMSTDPGAASLYRIDSAGTTPVPLIDTLTAFQPAWSPAGDRIVFAGVPPGESASLFVMPAAGGAAVRLTHGADGSASSPVWLPDGRIVYLASGTGGAEFRWLEPSSPAGWRTIPLPAGEPSSPAYLSAP